MKRLVPYIAAMSISAIVSLSGGFAQIEFTRHTIDGQFDGPAGIFAGDIDGDGDMDVVGAAINSNEITWWRNDSNGTVSWTKQTIDGNFGRAAFAYAEDVDDDSDLDVLGASWDDNEIAWWRNDGGDPIVWTKQTIDGNFGNAHEVYACDLDEDSDIDVLGAGAADNEIAWWRNDGGNPIVWTKQTIGSNFEGARSVCVADFDGDNDNDVAGAALLSDDVTWWRNDGGNPIVWTEITIDGNFNGSHMVRVFDMDADGDPDILGAAYASADIAWWRNDGGDPLLWTKHFVDGNFASAVIAHAADFDDDGDLDVVGSGQDASDIAWWRNDGGDPIVWEKYMIDDNFGGVWPIDVKDIDGDFDVDIVAGGNSADEVRWWENTLYGAQFQSNVTTGHAPLTVHFSDLSKASPPPTAWQWDFNNDSLTDSEEQNPTWLYTEPGTYSVSLVVSNGSAAYSRLCENCIRVFDGESALEFNGQDSYASCPAAASLNLTDEMTIEAWIYPTGWGEFPNFGLGKIIDKRYLFLQLIESYPGFNQHSLRLQLFHQDGTLSYASSPEMSITLNQWQHVAVTYNGQDDVKVFVNGLEQIVSYTTLPSGPIMDNNPEDISLGNDESLSSTFEGIIDEVRIWKRARSGEDIAASMNSYLLGNEPELVANWQLNEGDGEILADHSGQGHQAILVNAAWIQGVNLNPPSIDDDEDGIINSEDNCPAVYNPEQKDLDTDAVGDACDNCPDDMNPDQSDTDQDSTGDVCDKCTDTDGDGYGDPGHPNSSCDEDNCPDVYNPHQTEVQRGDINCQDGINVLDVLAAINHILGNTELIGAPLDRADCNNDDNVNILDALGIINVILGIGECEP